MRYKLHKVHYGPNCVKYVVFNTWLFGLMSNIALDSFDTINESERFIKHKIKYPYTEYVISYNSKGKDDTDYGY